MRTRNHLLATGLEALGGRWRPSRQLIRPPGARVPRLRGSVERSFPLLLAVFIAGGSLRGRGHAGGSLRGRGTAFRRGSTVPAVATAKNVGGPPQRLDTSPGPGRHRDRTRRPRSLDRQVGPGSGGPFGTDGLRQRGVLMS